MDNANDDLGIIVKNYKEKGFDVQTRGDYLVVKKTGHETRRIKITIAIKLLNAVVIEKL